MNTKITTIEEAFKYLNRDFTKMPDVSMLPEPLQKFIIACYYMATLMEALNQEANEGNPWQPNWNDHDEYKYQFWQQVEASEENTAGFGFSFSFFVFSYSFSYGGSRLCAINSDIIIYIETHPEFKQLNLDYFLF